MLFTALGLQAQIRGVVSDASTHEPLLYVTVQYEGKGVGAITNNNGEFSVEVRRGWNVLTFSSIGYKTKRVEINGQRTLNVELEPESTELAEVVVTQRARYSRRNNPAVDFMRKVIAHKKGNKLEENDFYSYQKYEKIKMSINDVTNEKLEKGIYKRFAFFKDQVEESPKTGKQILPISVKETGSRTIYRKSPKSKKTIIEGMNSSGVDEFFSTGDMMGTILTDVFSDINIYDDDIRLLQRQFVSPIGRGAITFYQYYLEDTIHVDGTECIHLSFVPQNPQDFGFTGHLYVAKDSTYAVKRATMNLPKKTGVNFVEHLDIVQNYEQLPDSSWILTDDDMTVELAEVKEPTLAERIDTFEARFDLLGPVFANITNKVFDEFQKEFGTQTHELLGLESNCVRLSPEPYLRDWANCIEFDLTKLVFDKADQEEVRQMLPSWNGKILHAYLTWLYGGNNGDQLKLHFDERGCADSSNEQLIDLLRDQQLLDDMLFVKLETWKGVALCAAIYKDAPDVLMVIGEDAVNFYTIEDNIWYSYCGDTIICPESNFSFGGWGTRTIVGHCLRQMLSADNRQAAINEQKNVTKQMRGKLMDDINHYRDIWQMYHEEYQQKQKKSMLDFG